MKIVIAPDSFKGNMSAYDAAVCIERGIKRVFPKARCIKVPMADGGEGTVACLLRARGGALKTLTVSGPAQRPVRASYGILAGGRTAVIEMAAASGLPLALGRSRNPLKTTSYGTGELIKDAIDTGVRDIIIGLGGSATIDGGAGMAQALGVRFRNSNDRLIRSRICGAALGGITSIDLKNIHPGLVRTRITAGADVSNPLCGTQGAARVFGAQKGATPEMIVTLDKNLRHYGRLIRNRLKIDVMKLEGAGAAGGMGAALVAFTGATIRSGIDLVMESCRLERLMKGADLVLTGEGLIDAQTPYGKAPAGVARLAQSLSIPVIAIGGGLADDAGEVFNHGIDGLASAAARDISLAEAISLSRDHLANAAERCMRMLVVGSRIGARIRSV